jgi:hypothetical protein
MKFKALRRKDTKEFVIFRRYNNVDMLFTAEFPTLLAETADIEYLKKKNEFIDFEQFELVEIDVFVKGDDDSIGADIRNKLTPIKNLLALLTAYDKEPTESKKYLLKIYIYSEMKNCKNSLKYLQDLL